MTKKRFVKKQKYQENILKSNDPLIVARHLVDVLEANGYSTRSYNEIDNYHSVSIMIHNGLESPLVIENMAQKWRLKEDREELPF